MHDLLRPHSNAIPRYRPRANYSTSHIVCRKILVINTAPSNACSFDSTSYPKLTIVSGLVVDDGWEPALETSGCPPLRTMPCATVLVVTYWASVSGNLQFECRSVNRSKSPLRTSPPCRPALSATTQGQTRRRRGGFQLQREPVWKSSRRRRELTMFPELSYWNDWL